MFKLLATASVVSAKTQYRFVHDYSTCWGSDEYAGTICLNMTNNHYVDDKFCDEHTKSPVKIRCRGDYRDKGCKGDKKQKELEGYNMAGFELGQASHMMYTTLHCKHDFVNKVNGPIRARCVNNKLMFKATKTQKLKDIVCKPVDDHLTLDVEKVVLPKQLAPLKDMGIVCRGDFNDYKLEPDATVKAKTQKEALKQIMGDLPEDRTIFIRTSRRSSDKHYVYWNEDDVEDIQSMKTESWCIIKRMQVEFNQTRLE